MRPRRTLKEWIATFIENDGAEYWEDHYDARDNEDDYMGSRTLDSDHEDGYYDDMELDIDDGMLEGLLIVGLAATLLVLVYVRQQQQRNRQNAQANGNGNGNGDADANANANAGNNANDRGFFPRPGDPEFGQWVAGGVGH